MNKPKHIAIVMDGNGRWAQKRGLPRVAGHRAGVNALREVVRTCSDMGIEALTVFAFSTENWQRPRFEVKHLGRLFAEGLRRFVKELHKNNVCMRFTGDYEAFGKSITKQVHAAIETTKNNTGLKFTSAINYSGRTDIVKATQQIARLVQLGDLTIDQIDEHAVSQFVALSELPSPDLFIRTSGEKRISNFLLWQSSYSELYFTDRLWPDFGKEAIQEAVEEFANRDRRFGRTQEQVEEA